MEDVGIAHVILGRIMASHSFCCKHRQISHLFFLSAVISVPGNITKTTTLPGKAWDTWPVPNDGACWSLLSAAWKRGAPAAAFLGSWAAPKGQAETALHLRPFPLKFPPLGNRETCTEGSPTFCVEALPLRGWRVTVPFLIVGSVS